MLSGLTRVRQFSQDDGHCFIRSSRLARRSSGCCGWCSGSTTTSGSSTPMKLSTRPEEFLGEHRDLEPRRSGAEGRARPAGQALHHQRGRRRVLRPEDRFRRHRRHRPEVAVRHDSARLPAPGAVRPEIRRRRQRRAPARRRPSRHFRQLRAVHCAADRALRRRVAAVAGPGPGRRPADFRPTPGLRPAVRDRWPPPGCASNWTTARRRLAIRSERRSCRRSPTCW